MREIQVTLSRLQRMPLNSAKEPHLLLFGWSSWLSLRMEIICDVYANGNLTIAVLDLCLLVDHENKLK